MAYIKGTFFTTPWTGYFDDFDDDLNGTSAGDTIEGLGGDDTYWGGLGDDNLHGGAGDDFIRPNDANVDIVSDWGYDKVWGGPGTDNLYFVKTTHNTFLNGEEGTDFISGGSAIDIIDGGSEGDYIWGFGGGDYIGGGTGSDDIYAGFGNDTVAENDGGDLIFGDAGNDYLVGDDSFGGTGNDTIYGGDGHDTIDGGKGKDTLPATAGTTTSCSIRWTAAGNPDHITDFTATVDRWIGAYDRIDTQGPAGTASNYFELSIGYNDGFNEAKDFAQGYIGGNTRYVFVTDYVNGYFFSDVNGNGTMDNAIVLDGLGSLSDFGHKNVVDL